MRVYVDSLRRDGVNKRATARTWAVVSDVAVVHARPRAFVAPADATSASCDVRSRDDSGRPHPRIAPSADRDDCVA